MSGSYKFGATSYTLLHVTQVLPDGTARRSTDQRVRCALANAYDDAERSSTTIDAGVDKHRQRAVLARRRSATWRTPATRRSRTWTRPRPSSPTTRRSTRARSTSVLATTQDDTNLTIAQFQKQWFEEAGVRRRAASDQIDQAKYIVTALLGNFQVFQWRNHGGVDLDAQYIWWHSSNALPVGQLALNFGRIKDAVIDQALDANRGETDPAKKKELRRDGQQAVRRPVLQPLGLVTRCGRLAHTPKVHGLEDFTAPSGEPICLCNGIQACHQRQLDLDRAASPNMLLRAGPGQLPGARSAQPTTIKQANKGEVCVDRQEGPAEPSSASPQRCWRSACVAAACGSDDSSSGSGTTAGGGAGTTATGGAGTTAASTADTGSRRQARRRHRGRHGQPVDAREDALRGVVLPDASVGATTRSWRSTRTASWSRTSPSRSSPTPTTRCGRSRPARASRSTTARRSTAPRWPTTSSARRSRSSPARRSSDIATNPDGSPQIVVTDPMTVTITMKRPWVDLPDLPRRPARLHRQPDVAGGRRHRPDARAQARGHRSVHLQGLQAGRVLHRDEEPGLLEQALPVHRRVSRPASIPDALTRACGARSRRRRHHPHHERRLDQEVP